MPSRLHDDWFTGHATRARRELPCEMTASIIDPDQQEAGRGRGDKIEIAVMIDVALNNAGDSALQIDGRRRTGKLDRNKSYARTFLNERTVDSPVAIEVTERALRRSVRRVRKKCV